MKLKNEYYIFQPLYSQHEILYVKGGENGASMAKTIKNARVIEVVIDGWDGKDLNFLLPSCDRIERLTVNTSQIPDVTAINEMRILRALTLVGNVEQVDFGRFKSLNLCSLECAHFPPRVVFARKLRELKLLLCALTDLSFVNEIPALRALTLEEISLKALSGVGDGCGIKFLNLARMPLRTLDGVQNMTALETIQMCSLRRLSSIRALTTNKCIQTIEIESCRKITDLEAIKEAKQLRRLALIGVGRMPTLTFLESCKQLCELYIFEDTIIADGDLNRVLKLPCLVTMLFRNRNHYSHTQDEVSAFLKERKVAA